MENLNLDKIINEVMKEVLEKAKPVSETSQSAEKSSAYDFQNRLDGCSDCSGSSGILRSGQDSAYNFQNR